MNAPTTINGLLDSMQSFVDQGREIEASDLPHETKLSRLTALSEVYGLA